MSASDRKPEPLTLVFGFEEEWREFGRRHAEFMRRFPNIEKAIELAFNRSWGSTELLDRTLYFLGRLVQEEFMEILLLCANGYGIGAQKLVRGMYERAVTASYLRQHPEEVNNFLAFHKVADHKLLKAVQSTFGDSLFTEVQVQQIEQDFAKVKEQFMITGCKVCNTRRLNHTWSKRDIVTMARMAGVLGSLIVPAYYLPTREAHSTIGAIFSRLDADAATTDGALIFEGAAQRERADEALISAHNILLNVLDLENEHFQIKGLDEALQTCFEDFMISWSKSATK